MIELVGLFAAFFILFILRFKGIDFAISIFTACLIIGLTSGKPLIIFWDAGLKTVLDSATWDLCAAVALITVLGYCLKETGLMVELIENLRNFLPGKALLALIPALFGILSMPGGALMSAPFIEGEAQRLKLKPEHKTFVNIWYRHVWYWVSPISPTTLILCRLSGLDLRQFITINFPIFVASWVIGWFAVNRFIKDKSIVVSKEKNIVKTIKLLSPILITIVFTILNIPVWASVLTGISLVFLIKKVPIKTALKYLWFGVKWDTVISVLATLYFRYFLTMSETVTELFKTIINIGLPIIIIMLIAPMLVGAISGTPTMGVGIIIPLLLPLLTSVGVSNITIIFAGIVSGYTWSPIHLCLILTNQYYRSDLNKVYKYLIPPIIVLYIFAVCYHLILNF